MTIKTGVLIDYDGLIAQIRQKGSLVSDRQWNLIRKDANRAGVLFWHKHLLKLRFQAGAQKPSDYKKRKDPYSNIKRRLAQGLPVRVKRRNATTDANVTKGGVVDNVRSGTTEEMALQMGVVSASRNAATMTIRVPRYAAIRRADPSMPNTAAELLMTTEKERRMIRRVIFRRIMFRVPSMSGKFRVRISP